MTLEQALEEGVINVPVYQLATHGMKKYPSLKRRPKKLVDKMIEDSDHEGRKKRIQRLRKDIEEAIPEILKHERLGK